MQPAQKHIAILCSRLDLPGGIERAVVNTANLFAQKGHPVTVVILDVTAESFYPVAPGVTIVQERLSFGITKEGNILTRKKQLLSDTLKLRRLLKNLQAGCVISTEYPFTVTAILSGVKKYSRIFSWEHHHYAWLQKNKFWTTLCRLAYTRLTGIICLNSREAEHYKKSAPAFIIPNFIENTTNHRSSGDTRLILSAGWLIPRKGIDFIMQAAKEVLNSHPDWKWKLIGDGEMKEQVMAFIEKEKLQGRFILQPPLSADMAEEYTGSSLFVLASRFEAFPMVLLEAMHHGVPCISFDCPSGPSDIITDEEDGLLVDKENPVKLAAAISTLISDEKRRKKMGAAAAYNIQRFSPDKVYQMWEQVILIKHSKH